MLSPSRPRGESMDELTSFNLAVVDDVVACRMHSRFRES